MDLGVITHTRPGKKHKWFDQCIQSVKDSLPDGAIHHIIEFEGTESEFSRARYECKNLNEYICFVDDDDYIVGDSIRKCVNAIGDNGVAFTNETLLFSDKEMPCPPRPIAYIEITLHPRTIHHLAVMKSKFITNEMWDLHEKYNLGIEWFMKAGCALKHGAIHVPEIGYMWRQHDDSHSHTADWIRNYETKMFRMGADIRNWLDNPGVIPQVKKNS